jgi:hypothetical protein
MGMSWRRVGTIVAVFVAGLGVGAIAHRTGALQPLFQWDTAARHERYVAARRGVQQAFPARGRYAMLGDSITEEMTAWREAFPGAAIVNLGISGDTTAGVLQRLDTVIATGAGTVFLLIGINDLQILGGAPAEVAARHAEIRRRLTQAGMRVVVLSLFTGKTGLRAGVADVNARLEKSCAAPACRFVDLNAALSENGLLKPAYTYDGVHLTAEGYKAWVRRISGLIE